jgi:hypothetical protein
MLTLAEIGPALYGAWRLAHLDPDGMRYFDRSVTGFWRSFRVAILAAPLWIIILAVSPLPATGGWFRLVVAETIGYVIQWVAFPLAAFYLTYLTDRRREYFVFITALNWASLIQLGVQMPADVLANVPLMPADLGTILIWGAQLAALVYEWFITRTALRLSGFGAVGFVVVDYLIGSVVNSIAVWESSSPFG